MKRVILFLTLAALVCMVPTVQAQQKYPLGLGNLALKVDYFRFMDSNLEDLDAENGVYVGLEAYYSLFHPNFYVGMESGWARTEGDIGPILVFPAGFVNVDLTIDYVPVELNLKYVFDISPCLTLDLGAGFSFNFINFEVDAIGLSNSEDDWLLGGQFFADVNYKFPNTNLFIGANFKYQITEEISLLNIATDTSADNLRVGAQMGFFF